jgi:hypothetical protein
MYNITKYDGDPLATVQDGTLNTSSSSITLIGKNAVNYGLALNENFVALLQNFANSSPPPMPQQGQIWFDTVSSAIKIFNGISWIVVSPPFDGNAGIAQVSINPTLEVMVMLSGAQIVGAVSHVSLDPSQLANDVSIADFSYAFKSRFPTGLAAGITLATDSNNYTFSGVATKANVLTTSRTITLSGSMSGNVAFDGSSNVTLQSNLINVLNSNLNTSSFWSKVQVSSNGLVTDANVIVQNDVLLALGYVPPSDIIIQGDATGNAVANNTVFTVNVSLGNTTVTPGSYNNVTVGADGRVISGTNDQPVPIKSIVLWEDILIPNNWALCDGQVITTPSGVINTPNLIPYQIGNTQFIMRVT